MEETGARVGSISDGFLTRLCRRAAPHTGLPLQPPSPSGPGPTLSSHTAPLPMRHSHPAGTNSGAQVCPAHSDLAGLKTPNLRKKLSFLLTTQTCNLHYTILHYSIRNKGIPTFQGRSYSTQPTAKVIKHIPQPQTFTKS